MSEINYEKLDFMELLKIIEETGTDEEVLRACSEITRRRQARFYSRDTA